jgi:signal transduction histidine kinase
VVADVDPDRIREAVDNLIDNALRFAPPGTAIVLTASAVGRDVVVGISDDGPGFPADYLPHAFERFRRPDSGRATAANGPGGGAVVTVGLLVWMTW